MRASLPAAIHRSAQAQAAFAPAASASAKTVMQSIPDRTGNLSMAPALVAAHAGPQSKATASAGARADWPQQDRKRADPFSRAPARLAFGPSQQAGYVSRLGVETRQRHSGWAWRVRSKVSWAS